MSRSKNIKVSYLFAAALVATSALPSRAAPVVFSAPEQIAVEGQVRSGITATGLAGTVTDVNVTLYGISLIIAYPLNLALIGPDGQRLFLSGNIGTSSEVRDVTVTFDDAAAEVISRYPVPNGSGTYRPVGYPVDTFGQPPGWVLPSGSDVPTLAAFNGLSGNGEWSLYVLNFGPGSLGAINRGWSIEISTDGGGDDEGIEVPEPASAALLGLGLLAGGLAIRRRR